jgi:Serine aminopeptidase, S33
MDRHVDCLNNPLYLEQAGYLEFHGAHIYYVLHGTPDPVARVLLVGPFASERYFSYVPWVRWARFLAARRIEALRFDYRGVGESTGGFEKMSFAEWNEDVEFLAERLQRRSPQVPLILHGLELGAILASKTFAAGMGDALLLWSAPLTANEVLRRPLSRHAFKNLYCRKSLSDYIQELEAHRALEVEGYEWSDKLWQESFTFKTPDVNGEESDASRDGRPVKVVNLEGGPASLLKGSAMGYIASDNLDLSDLYSDSFEWMIKAPAVPQGRRS